MQKNYLFWMKAGTREFFRSLMIVNLRKNSAIQNFGSNMMDQDIKLLDLCELRLSSGGFKLADYDRM